MTFMFVFFNHCQRHCTPQHSTGRRPVCSPKPLRRHTTLISLHLQLPTLTDPLLSSLLSEYTYAFSAHAKIGSSTQRAVSVQMRSDNTTPEPPQTLALAAERIRILHSQAPRAPTSLTTAKSHKRPCPALLNPTTSPSTETTLKSRLQMAFGVEIWTQLPPKSHRSTSLHLTDYISPRC